MNLLYTTFYAPTENAFTLETRDIIENTLNQILTNEKNLGQSHTQIIKNLIKFSSLPYYYRAIR